MSRLSVALSLLVALLTLSPAQAQTVSQAEPGNPPLISLIDVSPADADGNVTISGVNGAVFPNARLAIRNLYTGQTVYAQAGVTGSFSAQIFGPGNTPFWISPVAGDIPVGLRDFPGSLPGGPGTIIYGPFPETRQAATPVTQILLDGDLADWEAYPRARFLDGGLFGLFNQQSLYLAAAGLRLSNAQLQAVFTIDTTTYLVAIDPSAATTGQATRMTPERREIGPVPLAFADHGNSVELRIPLAPLDAQIQSLTLNELRVVTPDGEARQTLAVNQALEPTGEVDGVARLASAVGEHPARFTVGGAVGAGAAFWSARGRADRLAVDNRAEPLHLELDFRLFAAQAPPAVDFSIVGQLSLLPVVAEVAGEQIVTMSPLANNGWSTVRTPSGLAIDNLGEEIVIGEALVAAPNIVLHGSVLTFGLTFDLTLPETLPDGLYVPALRGFIETSEGRVPWSAGLFGDAPAAAPHAPARLPISFDLGAQQPVRLLWSLLVDHPSNGSRGLLADADRDRAMLSNRVRFDSPTYILPPTNPATGERIGYPLEPYLLNQLPNSYRASAAPLLPFLLPGGRLNVSVTGPDGVTDNLGSAPILQNQLSTVSVDERERFGEFSPVDVYRLTTLNPLFSEYTFEQDGEYRISMTGTLEDVWGNRYEGGGVYHVLVAELLAMTPGALPGTAFEVGDNLNPTLHLTPGVPADVTVTLRVYPLDGGAARETVIEGQANRFGYFHAPDARLRFMTPGEYTIDYEARYRDSQGRLWAGSLRSAGVIARPQTSLVLHGRRGLANIDADVRPAWYNGAHYAAIVGAEGAPLYPNAPYHSGDVVWLRDADDSGLMPALTLQDTAGAYERWLADALPNVDLRERIVRDSLPIALLNAADAPFGPALAPGQVVNDAYAYISIVRPGVTARQFVVGAEDGATPLALDPDDRYNRQTGAGFTGDRPGDYLFLFGGAVVRNPEAQLVETAIYGSLAVIIDADDPRGTRVYPPFRGQAGGPDGGPLLTIDGQPVELFFYPSAAGPGDILEVGDTLSIAGHVAPLLPSQVAARVTAPGGRVFEDEGVANAVGYFYDPTQDIVVDEAGVWTVEISVRHEGATSAGVVEPPLPLGGVPGAANGRFSVYVAPPNAGLLPLEREDTTFAPASRYNFNFTVPAGWNDVRAYYTLTMPGYVVGQGELTITGSSFSYPYDPAAVSARFPNFEPQARASGAWVSDPLTLTLFVTGVDEAGNTRAQTRRITLLHDRLLSRGDR